MTTPNKLDLQKDGLEGEEIAPWKVPNGNDAFQYAVGRTCSDGAQGLYRRRADERGTYGGWRWEANASDCLNHGILKLATDDGHASRGDKDLTGILARAGLSWADARTAVALILEERDHAYQQGYARGYNDAAAAKERPPSDPWDKPVFVFNEGGGE